MLNNKLFCTFSVQDNVLPTIEYIIQYYNILYKKIFIFELKDSIEFAITYNIEESNLDYIPQNTILIHRKKESNTLYTINALNELIKRLNQGVVDVNYKINWSHYKNTLMLTNQNDLRILKTNLYKIIEL
jgi:hypothetical protein